MLLFITFFGQLAFVCVGFSLRDTMHTLMLTEMNKSINSTQPGVVKTWNLIHQGKYYKSNQLQKLKSIMGHLKNYFTLRRICVKDQKGL